MKRYVKGLDMKRPDIREFTPPGEVPDGDDIREYNEAVEEWERYIADRDEHYEDEVIDD